MSFVPDAQKRSVNDFVKAFQSLIPLKDYQINMLRVLYEKYPDWIIPADLADSCGYSDDIVVSGMLGRLARQVGRILGIPKIDSIPSDECVLSGVLIDFDDKQIKGRWVWRLHPQVEKALKQLKIV